MTKNPEDRRTEYIMVRFTALEKYRAEELALRYEIPLTAYVRQLLRREYELTFGDKKSPVGLAPVRAGAGGPIR